MKCTKCSTDCQIDDFYTKSSGIKYRWCKRCMGKQSTIRHKALKQKAIDYMGGSCRLCQYDICNSALVFHHLDPKEKDFGIASNKTRNWDKLKVELDKCVMLCQNCHCEVHAGLKSI